MATMCAAPVGNMLAKQRKKEQEDSDVFPKLEKITGDTILRHQLDDTYSRSSYSKSYDNTKMMQMNFKGARQSSGRRNRPHPRKDWLMWRLPEHRFRKLTMTDDAGLWNWAKGGVDDSNRYETEYSRLYAGSPHNTAYSERKRLLNREEINRASLPVYNSEPEAQSPPSPSAANQQSGNASNEISYSDLNKFLGSDIWKDEEVFHQILETGDKRYLIKFLKTLSPETLLGLQKWLQANEEEKESEEVGEASHATSTNAEGSEPEAASTRLPPSTPMKDQSNNDKEPKTKINTSSPLEGKKKIIANLIDSADKKEIAQFLSDMIEPRSVRGVTHWLVSHEGKEREVALRFLGEVRFKPSKVSISAEKAREGLESPMSNVTLTRRSRKKRSPHGKNCSCAVCEAEHSNRILRALYNQGSSSVIDEMRRALECVPRPKKTKIRQQNQRKNQVPKLGGDSRMQRVVRGHLPNTNALFMQPHRLLPSFFVIHPELP